jgi:hypothetical protein
MSDSDSERDLRRERKNQDGKRKNCGAITNNANVKSSNGMNMNESPARLVRNAFERKNADECRTRKQ